MIVKMINSTVKDGNMSIKYDNDNTVYINREKFFQKVNIDIKKTLIINVNYKDDIFELDESFLAKNSDLSKQKISTDCIITKCPNIFMYLPFGDCIPMIIFDKKQGILAFAHMGWQSTELNLHLKIVKILLNKYNSSIENLEVLIGPSIKKQSYILNNPSQLKYNEWKPYLNHIGDDNYEIDLNGYICDGLRKNGIDKIENNEIDTAKNNQYYSHYRATYIDKREQEGRFICGAIMLEQ